MEKVDPLTSENFISAWNHNFPDHPFTLASLKSPQDIISAVLKMFNRIGCDSDILMSPPPEENRNNHIVYYQDLLPVINITRTFNHLVSAPLNIYSITISHFLQPTADTSHSMLMLLFNVMLFKTQRLTYIGEREKDYFDRSDQIKILEDKKNNLLQMINEQLQNKCKRAERLEKLEQVIAQNEEETKQEREALSEERKHLEVLMEENRQIEMMCEQKKMQRDAMIAEVERLRALRVYDADDIKAQAKQAVENVQEAEKKLTNLGDTLMQKENNLKNLQTTKHYLDTANSLLDEIIKQTESLKELESRDLESDSQEGELDVLQTELNEELASLAELVAAREDAARTRQQERANRQLAVTKACSTLREAEEKDAKCHELSKMKLQQNQEIKDRIIKYEEAKTKSIEELDDIKSNFTNELKKAEDILLKKVGEVKKQMEEKIRNRTS